MAPNRSILSLPLPKATISLLTAAGYETVRDLSNASVDNLVRDLGLSREIAEQVVTLSDPSGTVPSTLLPTQSAAALAQPSPRLSTGCHALDTLLKGGIQKGHILELSGPPGTPKELVAMNLTKAFAGNGDNVLIADCQNMVNRRALMEYCRGADRRAAIQYAKPQTLSQFLLFIEQLPSLLGQFSNDTLLVLSCMSTLFQATELSPSSKTALLQKLKQALAKLTLGNRITVVITGQLATKLLNSDGSPGTFDTGAQGIMVPQLGSSYLPSGKAWRVVFSPESQSDGHVKLLSSPHSALGSSEILPYSVRRL